MPPTAQRLMEAMSDKKMKKNLLCLFGFFLMVALSLGYISYKDDQLYSACMHSLEGYYTPEEAQIRCMV